MLDCHSVTHLDDTNLILQKTLTETYKRYGFWVVVPHSSKSSKIWQYLSQIKSSQLSGAHLLLLLPTSLSPPLFGERRRETGIKANI